MKIICKIGSCVSRIIAEFFSGTVHIHIPKSIYYLINRILLVKLPFEYPVYKQRNKTCKKVSFYTVFPLQIYWTRLEFCFHDAEAFFNLPAFLVDPDYLINIHVIKISADGIESIIQGFFLNKRSIEIRLFYVTYFSILCHCIFCNKTMGIVLVFWTLLVLAAVYHFLRPFYLSLTDLTLIVSVLYRIGNYKVLFKRFCSLPDPASRQILFYPAVFIEN